VFLCDSDNNVKNVSLSAKKHLGLSHKTIKIKEDVLDRPLKMDDIVLNFSEHEESLMGDSSQISTDQN
jgi:hypothetical protein